MSDPIREVYEKWREESRLDQCFQRNVEAWQAIKAEIARRDEQESEKPLTAQEHMAEAIARLDEYESTPVASGADSWPDLEDAIIHTIRAVARHLEEHGQGGS